MCVCVCVLIAQVVVCACVYVPVCVCVCVTPPPRRRAHSRSAPEGFDFTIRTPGTPPRWVEMDQVSAPHPSAYSYSLIPKPCLNPKPSPPPVRTLNQTPLLAHTRARAFYKCVCNREYTRARAYTHTRTHARTRAHTHTHTHTHTGDGTRREASDERGAPQGWCSLSPSLSLSLSRARSRSLSRSLSRACALSIRVCMYMYV